MMGARRRPVPRRTAAALFFVLAAAPTCAPRAAGDGDRGSLDRAGTLWGPYLEWAVENPSWSGNPYDLVAEVEFRHDESGRVHRTPMFYDGGDTWRFRFTGTAPGAWTFTTSSADPDLDGRSGTVTVRENPDPDMKGFVAGRFVDEENGSRWVRTATGEAFIPQYVMYSILEDPADLTADIATFIDGHGFTGFHVPVFCRWFDLDSASCRTEEGRAPDIPVDFVEDAYATVVCDWFDAGGHACPSPNPDRRTFEALERIIKEVDAAGGAVHLWMWGDRQRDQTPHAIGGLDGEAARRLERYIAARLGPLPGWTMGYGFDLDEWASREDLARWHGRMHALLGWPHMLGGRSAGPNRGADHAGQQIYDGLDYAGYEHHRPDYEVYVAALRHLPTKPAFSEDRFRIREGYALDDKDFGPEMTRATLWDSAMAGGVANIWGRVDADDAINRAEKKSKTYPNEEQLKTYSRFFAGRFLPDMVRDDAVTDGRALRSGDEHYLFYKEGASSVRMDLGGMAGARPAVAVDARKPYREIPIGPLDPRDQTWKAPYESDWAIAVGDFAADDPIRRAGDDPDGGGAG